MRSFIISIILFCSSGFCIAQEIHPIKSDGSCDDQNYKLSLFKTNDALFSASHCITIHNEEIDEINGIDGIEEIIHNSILVNGKKYELKSFRKEDSPSRKINLEAVSVYKDNLHPPLLIILFSEEFCCYPQPEGKDYTIHLYKIYKDFDNIETLGRQELYYSYLGFKMGKYDKAKGENVVNPNAKMADLKLRQALAYGLDINQMVKAIYDGLREKATSSVPPVFGKYYPKDLAGFPYDPEKAKKLLDEAGYKDVDGDGLREDNKGNKLVFNFAFQGGNNYDQALADTFIKSWKEVGLDVKLLDNKLMGKKEWDQRVLGDDPQIDLFLGAGHHGSDPSRQELFGRKSQFNYFRYTSDKIDEAFKEQRSDEMFDDNKLKQAYNKFDDLIADELPFFGLSWDTEITYVNKRVKHFNVEDFTKGRLSIENLELTKEAPEK